MILLVNLFMLAGRPHPLPTSPLQRGRSKERQAKGDGKPGKARQVKAYRAAG